MKKTIVIGHKNPDTDSICSAIAYADFKEQQGNKGVVPGRAGNINPQTEFVLNYFNQSHPILFTDVYPRISHIMASPPVTVGTDMPILSVMRKFKNEGVRFIPVVGETKKVEGTLVTLNLAERFSDHIDPATARKVRTTFKNISVATDSTVIVKSHVIKETDYYVFVGAMSEDSFNKTISGHDPSNLIIIVGDRFSLLKRSIVKKVGIILVTGGVSIPEEIIKAAVENGVGLMITPHDSASAAWLLKLSAPAGMFCSTKFHTVSPMDRIEPVKRAFLKSKERGIIVTDQNGNLQGVVTKSNFLKSPDMRLILMDHNEFSQAVDGADQVEIAEVIDHHRIADFHTDMPISIIVQPVGSTCTLVSEIFKREKCDLSKKIAGLLLSGIISDTVTGRSPTTTDRDIYALQWLERFCGVKSETYSVEMFSASSIIGHGSPREVLLNDFKEFVIGQNKVGVGQVEVVGFERFDKVKRELFDELNSLKKEKGYTLAGLMVTDITYETTLFLVSADYEIYNSIGLPEREKSIFEMRGVLSRKKQVMPHLFNVLK